MDDLRIIDRYSACGRPYPDPRTVCQGPCEGMGFFPQHEFDNDQYYGLWVMADRRARRTVRYWWDRLRRRLRGQARDRWHFVPCPHCHGTGKREL